MILLPGVWVGLAFVSQSGRNALTAFQLGDDHTQGFCLLKCHGKNHLPKNYTRDASPAVNCSACH